MMDETNCLYGFLGISLSLDFHEFLKTVRPYLGNPTAWVVSFWASSLALGCNCSWEMVRVALEWSIKWTSQWMDSRENLQCIGYHGLYLFLTIKYGGFLCPFDSGSYALPGFPHFPATFDFRRLSGSQWCDLGWSWRENRRFFHLQIVPTNSRKFGNFKKRPWDICIYIYI